MHVTRYTFRLDNFVLLRPRRMAAPSGNRKPTWLGAIIMTPLMLYGTFSGSVSLGKLSHSGEPQSFAPEFIVALQSYQHCDETYCSYVNVYCRSRLQKLRWMVVQFAMIRPFIGYLQGMFRANTLGSSTDDQVYTLRLLRIHGRHTAASASSVCKLVYLLADSP